MKIKLPAGFEPPKGTKPGDEFEVVATMKLSKDGYELLEVDGAPLDGDETESEHNATEEAAEEKQPERIRTPLDY